MNRKGTSLVLISILGVIFMGIAAISIDIGSVVLEKTRLSAAADAASLAGARDLIFSPDTVEDTAREYVFKNMPTATIDEIIVDPDNKSVEVNLSKNTTHFFAKIFNKSFTKNNVSSKSGAKSVSKMTGLRPFAVRDQTLSFGQLYTLREGSGDGLTGNYWAVALDKNGARPYKDNILYGYPGKISINDILNTETGVISNPTRQSVSTLIADCNHSPTCTFESFNKNCSRIISVPIITYSTLTGKSEVKVVGFASFFLENVSNHGGHTDIIGRFVENIVDSDTIGGDGADYGMYSIGLEK